MVTLTLSPEALARLDEIAAERGQTRSGAVEQLVRNARLRESQCVDCAKVATHQKCARGPESGHPFGTPLCTTHACPDCTPYAALAVNKLGERTEHWPEDAPCYKCGKPIGPPWSDKLIPTRPVCPVCAMDNIRTALDRYEPRPKPPTKRFI
jgi:hypothetical protein